VVSLPAASTYPTGAILWIVDESGSCSATNTITIDRSGSDSIDGATTTVLNGAYQTVALESNGSNAWTTVVSGPNDEFARVGVGTAPDPNNPLSVYGSSALFNGTNFNVTVNKAASSDTASLIFEDAFSGRAQMGLNGSDNFSFKVSPNGSSWITAIALDATTGAATLADQRTAVSDAAYSALVTDSLIAYTALTAARVVSLPAASAYPPGQALTIADESGACSASKTITISRAGSDTINGATTATISTAYAYLALESNGSNAWTIIDQSTLSMAQQTANAVAISGGAINGTPIGGSTPAAVAATTLSASSTVSGAGFTSLLAAYPRKIGQSSVPFILPSSGSMGNNGALTLTTALYTTFTAGAYVYLPAGAISTGSAAGWYYAVFSSTTAATVYNNTYTPGTPAIPASPTAFTTTGPGAYTQTTAAAITAYSLPIAANTIGINGSINVVGSYTNLDSSTTKYLNLYYGAYRFGSAGIITTPETSQIVGGFANRGVTGTQVALYSSQVNALTTTTTGVMYGNIDTTSSQSLTVQLELLSAATDWIVLEAIEVTLIPGVP
jgi:hypothetical protein